MLAHHVFVEIRRSKRVLFGDCVIVAAVANDRAGKFAREFGASFGDFVYRFSAARIVVAGVDAILVDCGSGTQNSDRVEQFDDVTGFGEANGSRCAVNACSGYRDPGPHVPLSLYRRRD